MTTDKREHGEQRQDVELDERIEGAAPEFGQPPGVDGLEGDPDRGQQGDALGGVRGHFPALALAGGRGVAGGG